MTANNLYAYFRERFPLPGVLFISISFALLAIGQTSSLATGSSLITFTLLVMLFIALLLRQRVTDEFKDMHHDAKNYPERPYQRGLVTKNNLLVLLGIAVILELVIAFLLSGLNHFVWYLVVFVYSLLMAKEFFAGKWLEQHFTTYFIIHELIFVLIAVWIASILELPTTIVTFSWMLAFLSIMMGIEIARKFEIRRDTKGKVVHDTYISVWGEEASRSAIELLVLTSGIALSYAEQSISFALVASAVSLFLNLNRPKTAKLQLLVGFYVLLVGVIGVLL